MSSLIEPAAFIYAGEDGVFSNQSFTQFFAAFQEVDDFCDANERRLLMSAELVEAVIALFPNKGLRPLPVGGGIEPEAPFRALPLILAMLERRSVAPGVRFADVADDWGAEPEFARADVLAVDDVWLGWRDLVSQAAARLPAEAPALEMLAVEPARSCAPAGKTMLSHRHADIRRTLIALRRDASETWPPGTLDPRCYRKLIERRDKASHRLEVVWENSGHQPPPSLKQLIVRTAAASGVVVRAGSIYFNPSLNVTCALGKGNASAAINYRASNSGGCVRGVFTTIAQDRMEQDICLALITREFRARCEQEGFALSGDSATAQ